MDLSNKKCIPCEVGGEPLDEKGISIFIKDLHEWTSIDNKKIIREFKFKNFIESMDLVKKVADIAESEGHHPDIYISYDKVTLELTTHAVKGLTENDFILASKVDKILANK